MVMIEKTFELYLQRKRFKAVARELNADGYRTINKSDFTGQTVSRILRDRKHLENGTVSKDLWDQAQEIITANKRSGGARRTVAHLCAGLLKCGCGTTMHVPTNSKKYTCGECRNKIAKSDLEEIVLQKLKRNSSQEIQLVLSDWSSLDFSSRREILESTISNIIAEDKKVTVSLFAFG